MGGSVLGHDAARVEREAETAWGTLESPEISHRFDQILCFLIRVFVMFFSWAL